MRGGQLPKQQFRFQLLSGCLILVWSSSAFGAATPYGRMFVAKGAAVMEDAGKKAIGAMFDSYKETVRTGKAKHEREKDECLVHDPDCIVREFKVSCAKGSDGATACNVSPHTIKEIRAVTGAWQATGYEATGGSPAFRKVERTTDWSGVHFEKQSDLWVVHNHHETDENWMCLMSNATSSQGTRAAPRQRIHTKTSMLMFWANQKGHEASGELTVSLLCKKV